MRILRVEHVDCPTSGHGPVFQPLHCSNAYGQRPAFGSRGPTPGSDAGILRQPLKFEVCGVLPHQADTWWGDPDRLLPDGWLFAEYDVSARYVHVGARQVIFDIRRAALVRFRRSPRVLVEARSPVLRHPELDVYPYTPIQYDPELVRLCDEVYATA